MNVKVRDEWSFLKSVVLGSAEKMYFQAPGLFFPGKASPLWIRTVDHIFTSTLCGKEVPRFIRRRFDQELSALKEVLIERGIKVFRPDRIEPLEGEEPGLFQVFTRDPLFTVGNTVIIGNQRLKTLRKEKRGFVSIINIIEESGIRVLKVPQRQEKIFLEGGDVIVDLPRVFVGIGRYGSNYAGACWLQDNLGNSVKIIPVKITGEGIFHLDTCMTLTGPGKGIICRSVLIDPLPDPLDKYEFVEVDDKTRCQIGVNIFMLDPQTILTQKRHVKLRAALAGRGYKVIPLKFSWHAIAGGAFRCVTQPLERD